MLRIAGMGLLLLLAGCGRNDPSSIVDRLFKARQAMLEKPELVGVNRDGGALLITYTDQAKIDGAWIVYACFPPVNDDRWLCERRGDPKGNVFLQ